MNEKEFYQYIKNREWRCSICYQLQSKIMIDGLSAIDDYNGMVCAGIETMQIKRRELKTKNLDA